MKVWARINHIGWVHLWIRRDSFEAGEASDHFFNGKSEPRWRAAIFSEATRHRMKLGELVEIEDPGYFPEDGDADESAAVDSSD